MKPCKHLDHNEATYGETCELKTLDNFSCPVKYWKRKLVPYEGAPENVQFCGKGRGRINGIFNCYNPGEMHCYEPEDDQHNPEPTDTVPYGHSMLPNDSHPGPGCSCSECLRAHP